MKKIDVAIVTQRDYISPTQDDWYHQNILLEDRLLENALRNQGFTTQRIGWDDPHFQWEDASCAIIRATWDYFHRIDEFKDWLKSVSGKTQLINPIQAIQWNLDKHYLGDCERKGVNIPPTTFIEAATKIALATIFNQSGWDQAVLKPCISGAARHTYVINESNLHEYEETFRELIAKESFMLQEFQQSVPEQGEWTLVMIDGKHTHAVLKKAKEGDFRVQDDFGGTVHHHAASKEEIAFAERVMGLIDPTPMYGRVDIIRDNSGALALQELELIEPELWFRNCENAAVQLAKRIRESIHDK